MVHASSLKYHDNIYNMHVEHDNATAGLVIFLVPPVVCNPNLNLLAYSSNTHRNPVVHHSPALRQLLAIDVGPTNPCHVSCVMCHVSRASGTRGFRIQHRWNNSVPKAHVLDRWSILVRYQLLCSARAENGLSIGVAASEHSSAFPPPSASASVMMDMVLSQVRFDVLLKTRIQ